MSGHPETPWRPPASLQRNGVRWMFAPLVAFLIFTVGPSVLAPILFILSLLVDLGRVHAPSPLAMLLGPLLLTIALWPFLWLYGYVRDELIAQPAEWKSIRLATIVSTVAMSVPSTLLSLAATSEMTSPPGGGGGIGFVLIPFMLFLLIPGFFGWLIGRGIAWLLRD